jgi:gamma-glutamyltranspeptidase
MDPIDENWKGSIADALLDKIRETGGIMTQRDLDIYEVQVRKALHGTYRGRSVYTTHAPSSGMVLLHMLNLVETMEDFVVDGRTALNTHRLVETMKCEFDVLDVITAANIVQLGLQLGMFTSIHMAHSIV